jgi:hypothetical protein
MRDKFNVDSGLLHARRRLLVEKRPRIARVSHVCLGSSASPSSHMADGECTYSVRSGTSAMVPEATSEPSEMA